MDVTKLFMNDAKYWRNENSICHDRYSNHRRFIHRESWLFLGKDDLKLTNAILNIFAKIFWTRENFYFKLTEDKDEKINFVKFKFLE